MQRPPGSPEALHSYEGGDSELFNYLVYNHKDKMCLKCVRFMIKILNPLNKKLNSFLHTLEKQPYINLNGLQGYNRYQIEKTV